MIEINHLYHRYIREYYALFDVNLHIDKTEKVALVGSEDSGKTSLIRILSKLEKPSSGEVLINGKDLFKVDYKTDLSVGYIPVFPIFYENKSVYDNLKYILKIRNVDKNLYDSSIKTVLKNFDLEKFENTQVKKLSLYEKYKLSFARLELRNLDILLVDNIFDNFGELKDDQKENLLKILKNFYEMSNLTMLIATSSPEIANSLSDKSIYFKSGSVVEALD